MGSKHKVGDTHATKPNLEAKTPLKEQQSHLQFYAQAVLSLCFSCSIAARKTEETKTSSRNFIVILQDTDFYGLS